MEINPTELYLYNDLDNEIDKDQFGKILGRFDTKISLQSQDAAYITKKRILDKNSNGIGELKSFYDQSKELSKSGKNPLNPNLDFNKSYMTDLLQGMINNGIKIKAIPIKNSWLELDSYNDFVVYKNMHEKNTLSKFFNISN